MSDPLGLSIGTTNLVAARVGNQPVSRRSVLTLSTGRGPGIEMSGFVERVGDPVPLVAPDGSAHQPQRLLVDALDALVSTVGGPASSSEMAMAVPAHWGQAQLWPLQSALLTSPNFSRDGVPARLVSDAVAALTALSANPGIAARGVVALLDFGGSGTSITLADAASAFEPIGGTLRYAEFSGGHVDQALLAHVLGGIGHDVDPAGTAAVGSLARLREECREAKERLSAHVATELVVELPGYRSNIRLTRTELEQLIEEPLGGVVTAFEDMLARNSIGWSDLVAVAIAGAGDAVSARRNTLTPTAAASDVGRGSGIDDREWMRRCAAVRDGSRLGRRVLTDGGDVLDLLSPVASAPLATLTGVVVQAAIRRIPVVLDGAVATAAALAAHRVTARTARWVVAGHASPDPGQAAALGKMRLRPLIDYAISLDDGTGALLALPHLQAAARLLAAAGAE